MSPAPDPLTTDWLPLWQLGADTTALPLPVVNGRFVKGVGGFPVWTALGPSDVPGVVAADAAWHNVGAAGEPAFEDGWSNYGAFAPARFRKLATGVVTVQGLVKRATLPASQSTIFTLPVGYRPHTSEVNGFACYGYGSDDSTRVNRIDVWYHGPVLWVEGSNSPHTFLSLVLEFPADA
jgi:hypothetical protein